MRRTDPNVVLIGYYISSLTSSSLCIFLVYTSVWFIALLGVNDQTNVVDENGVVTEDPGM